MDLDGTLEQLFGNQPFINITNEEAKNGCLKRKALQVSITCKACNGTGDIDCDNKHYCKECNGWGRVKTFKKRFFLDVSHTSQCKCCKGTGRIVDNPCSICNGSGKDAVFIDVHIPAGTKNNDNIRLNTSDLTGNDLYVSVRIV